MTMEVELSRQAYECLLSQFPRILVEIVITIIQNMIVEGPLTPASDLVCLAFGNGLKSTVKLTYDVTHVPPFSSVSLSADLVGARAGNTKWNNISTTLYARGPVLPIRSFRWSPFPPVCVQGTFFGTFADVKYSNMTHRKWKRLPEINLTLVSLAGHGYPWRRRCRKRVLLTKTMH